MTTRPVPTPPLPTNGGIFLAAYDTQVLDEARWQQEVLLGTNGTDKVSGMAFASVNVAGRNLLANASFASWVKAGTGPIDASAGETAIADGWRAASSNPTAQAGGNEAQWGVAGTFGAGGYIRQSLVNMQEFRGRTLTFWARNTAGTPFYVALTDDAGGVSTPASGPTTAGGTSACALAVSATATRLDAWIFAAAAGAMLFERPMLVCTAAVPVQQLPAHGGGGARRRFLRVPFACRFRATAAGHVETYTINFPRLEQAPIAASGGLYGSFLSTQPYYDPSVSDNNIDTTPTKTLIADYDATHATVQITASFGASDTYVRNGYLLIDSGI